LKNVLVVYYSQSGQLLEIAKNVTQELEDAPGVNLSFYEIKLKQPFPFPWNRKNFYNAFPETFRQVPDDLEDLTNPLLSQKYDLVILAYQVWYLTPSIPINSFLMSEEGVSLIKDTPVLTLIGCRNMWIMAQEKVKKLILEARGRLVGNIALVDRHINHISVITIIHWMFTGKKTRYLGIFPKPGVAQNDIDRASRFGPSILRCLLNDEFDNLQEKLLDKMAVRIKPFLVVMDKRANFLFGKWSKLISTKGEKNSQSRRPWIKLFNIYLVFAIWVIAPIVFLLFLLTFPLRWGSIKKDKIYYSSVSYRIKN